MTYDINILGDITQSRPALDMNGTFNKGAVKLAQRIMILLLTDKDTDAFGRGTSIPRVNREANAVDTGVLEQIFAIATGDVKQQLDVTYKANTPADEKLKSISAVINKIDEGSYEVTLKITTFAGTALQISIPQSLSAITQES